jgi:hypothetical protein
MGEGKSGGSAIARLCGRRRRRRPGHADLRRDAARRSRPRRNITAAVQRDSAVRVRGRAALLLSAIGVCGVLSYSVSSHARNRRAVALAPMRAGCSRSCCCRIGMRLASIGAAIGLVGAGRYARAGGSSSASPRGIRRSWSASPYDDVRSGPRGLLARTACERRRSGGRPAQRLICRVRPFDKLRAAPSNVEGRLQPDP